jgi:hypothetical protein
VDEIKVAPWRQTERCVVFYYDDSGCRQHRTYRSEFDRDAFNGKGGFDMIFVLTAPVNFDA